MLRLAREQRTKAVQAEAIIWRAVRDRRCEGAKFRRQATIGNFIADFVCYERRLIVEIDGPSHESGATGERPCAGALATGTRLSNLAPAQ